MKTLVLFFWNLCLLRARPQEVPASPALLALALLLDTLVSVTGQSFGDDPGNALGGTLVASAVLLGLTAAALAVARHPRRWLQTATAILGSSAVLGVIAMPVLAWLQSAAADGRTDGAVPALLWLALFFWTLTVLGHILRHALDTSLALGTLVAAGFLTSALLAVAQFFPLVTN